MHTLVNIYMRVIIVIALLTVPILGSADDDLLSMVKNRQELLCGVNKNLPGFSAKDEAGNWAGLDVDFCRAVAAAIFGDDRKVKFIPLSASERFDALEAGDIDILARNTTWNLSRDTERGFDFVGVNFYDGQGFIIKKLSNIKTIQDLDNTSICVLSGTTTVQNLRIFFRDKNLNYTPEIFEDYSTAMQAYLNNECQSFTADRSALASQLSQLDNPENHIILEDTISREPLGPVVSHGDNEWADVIRWTLLSMIVAEHLGISSANAKNMLATSNNDEVQRLLGGLEGEANNLGKKIGLAKEWAFNIIHLVGNYGEIYDNNVGPKTALRLERGLNNLWTRGGLMYAPPFK